MFASPEVDDEVELAATGKGKALDPYSSGPRVGDRGFVGYSSYAGGFIVFWTTIGCSWRYEQDDLGPVVKVVKPRRGQKKGGEPDVAPFKGRP